jgi:hypothetical protein
MAYILGRWIEGASHVIKNSFPASVLTTVNGPHSKKLDAEALAHCLLDEAAAKAAPGHMSIFFGEMSPNFR